MQNDYSGLLLVNKPSGITSFKLVNLIRKKLQIKKAGHCGTLDPLASGLMLVLTGKATKSQDKFMKQDKVYFASVKLGTKTDSGDLAGKVVQQSDYSHVDIDKIKDKVDVIIVAMHWGTEYMQTPTDEQVREAQYLADLGVNIIIGNHPHSLQPITWLNNNNTLVIYSLGNFISNQGILYSTIGYKGVIGAFATLDIDKTTFNGESKISLDNLEVELLYTYKNSQQRYYKIIPFSKMNNNYLNNYQSVYETYKNVIQKYDQNIVVKPCA